MMICSFTLVLHRVLRRLLRAAKIQFHSVILLVLVQNATKLFLPKALPQEPDHSLVIELARCMEGRFRTTYMQEVNDAIFYREVILI
jgi:hypothetical protein